eukprot:scaffold210829_cov48-Prasinocladus_malaysianus.AAC.1
MPPVDNAVEVEMLPDTVVDVAVNSPNHSTLVAAVAEAGLGDALSGAGPLTVFAPTNAAFAIAMESMNMTPSDFLASPDLADILRYHVVAGKVLIMVNGATVTVADVEAGNGVVHVIDGVLMPQTGTEEQLPATVVDVATTSPNHRTL